jgi:hypothetical protein
VLESKNSERGGGHTFHERFYNDADGADGDAESSEQSTTAQNQAKREIGSAPMRGLYDNCTGNIEN